MLKSSIFGLGSLVFHLPCKKQSELSQKVVIITTTYNGLRDGALEVLEVVLLCIKLSQEGLGLTLLQRLQFLAQ